MPFELQDLIVIYLLSFIRFELSSVQFELKLKQDYNSQSSYSIFQQVQEINKLLRCIQSFQPHLSSTLSRPTTSS